MGILKNKKSLRFGVMFLAESLNIQCSASIAFDESNTLWAKPKPLYNKKRARIKGKNPSILALFVFINELMLTHHELASP